MAKEINEKTFELNITNELLNLSKSFIWYLDHFFCIHYPFLYDRKIVSQFMHQTTLFAEGLTQVEENNSKTGGYDVSINYGHPNGQEGRLMFLQYKAGVRKSYSNKNVSKFYSQTAINENRSPEHVMFTFNDAAGCTQHSILRNLANTNGINPNSVLYVFPRITEMSDFKSKVGKLIPNSSFVPILEIDKQAANQNPIITINNGVSHKYRTSYNGLTSEINYDYFFYSYNNEIISDLLTELICIQIERFTKIILMQKVHILELFLNFLLNRLENFIEYELEQYPAKDKISKNVNSYIISLIDNYSSKKQITQAPSQYTIVISEAGLKLEFKDKLDFSEIKYQLF